MAFKMAPNGIWETFAQLYLLSLISSRLELQLLFQRTMIVLLDLTCGSVGDYMTLSLEECHPLSPLRHTRKPTCLLHSTLVLKSSPIG